MVRRVSSHWSGRRSAFSMVVIGAVLFTTALRPTGAAIGDEQAPVVAPRPAVADSRTAPKPHPINDQAGLEAFFDGALFVQHDSKHIAGAVVAVVVGDKLVFSKGYGYADVETRRPVDPQTTQFRIASVSKLFTWTAAMQLVEEGQLDLDADINTYLKGVQIPPAFDKPITLKHLLTHAPGFEDRPIGLFAHHASDVKPLADVLSGRLPLRVRAPGELAAYSNYGSALAGLAVASVTGKPWEDVLEQRLLKPLGMKDTLVRQPPKDKLPQTLSKGYKWEGGRFKEEGFEYVPEAPAGAMSASAGDMAKFLIAHLNDGLYENVRILKPETARQMRERLWAHDPKVDAMCYGFWELHRNGQRILHHGGDTLLFHTLFAMIPEHRVGLFVSYNTDRGSTGRDEVLSAFLDRYYPVPQEPRLKSTTAVDALKRFEGEYSPTRHSHSTYAKLALLIQPYSIKANSDGTLTAGFENGARRYVEVEPLVFHELDGHRRIVFHEDDKGRITQLYFADAPAVALVRNFGLDQPRLHEVLVGACAGLFATALLFWPALAFTVRGLKFPTIRRTPASGLAACVGWLLSAAALLFLVGLVLKSGEPERLGFGTPRDVQWLLLLPQVCAVLAAITLLCSIVAWSKGYWRFSGRVHYTLVALAGVGFVWFLHYWNLLEFTTKLPGTSA